ncbi:hypothetical protein ACQRBN_07070 [Bariatricus sp. SGI.154]|uniref:hypothetical protein n=1 Tax=Bariatricus sp. SGI.154 TaxID=3420549 RepID=UPI003D045400
MNIQTAGQQKYYDFIQERAKKLQTGMIVWASLLAVAFICLFSNIMLALILAVAGAFLAVTNMKSQKELKSKLDGIRDQEEFFHQLADPNLTEIPDYHLMIAKDYVLVEQSDVYVYQLEDMEKVEVGLQGNVKKTLFLTDKQGVRHEIVSCVKDDGMQKKFDQVYHELRARVS